MFSLLFLIASVFAVEVSLTDGQKFNGELQRIADGRVTLKTDNSERDFDLLGVDKLVFTETATGTSQPAVIVELNDKSFLGAQNARIAPSEEAQQRNRVAAELTMDGEKSIFPLSAIRSIRYSVNNKQLLKQWQEIRAKSDGVEASSDFLVINRKGNLDYLAGIIEKFDAETIQFNYSGDSLNIPITKAAGLIFAKTNQSVPAAKFVVTTGNGSIWQLKELGYTGTELEMTSVSGARHKLASTSVQSIEFIRTGVVYASDLEGQNIRYEAFLQSPTIGKSVAALGQPRLDQSFAGAKLAVLQDGKPRSFERGLAMKSRSEITYRLAKKYQRFQTTVGIAPDAGKQGDVDLKLLADNKEVFQRSISKSDPPIEIDISVADTNRLTVVVDYGRNLDIGDQLHLGDARFTK